MKDRRPPRCRCCGGPTCWNGWRHDLEGARRYVCFACSAHGTAIDPLDYAALAAQILEEERSEALRRAHQRLRRLAAHVYDPGVAADTLDMGAAARIR